MRLSIKRLSAILILAACLIVSLALNISASASNTITLSFSENEAKETVISVYIPSPEALTGIDFTLSLSSEKATIRTLSTENSDTEKSAIDFDNITEDTSTVTGLTYRTSETAYKISFSGFFIEAYTSNEDFYICDIIITPGDGYTETDTITFEYTLAGVSSSRSVQETFFPGKAESSEEYEAPPRENNFSYPLGDSDLSGNTDASDARKILRASVGLDKLQLEEAAFSDTDYDGVITAADARYALRASVGLENSVTHRFSISLEGEKKCEEGGKYTFTCELTGISFSMNFEKGGHILRETDCFSTGKCIVCNESLKAPVGHKYNKDGICTVCSVNKNKVDEISKIIIPLIDEMHMYDILAQEALHNSKNAEFIDFTQNATKSLKKAVDACKGIRGTERTAELLSEAYKIRFDAFISCMDESGKILSSNKNCDIIHKAVVLSGSLLENLDIQ